MDKYLKSIVIEVIMCYYTVKLIRGNKHINYKDLEPSIRRGIKTIIEYWKKLDKDIDIDDNEDMDAGIMQLLEDNSPDRFGFSCSVENLCDRLFKRFGYDNIRARIIKDKLVDLGYSDNLNYEYIVKLLREFDRISCCLADLGPYPLTLIQSLYAITALQKHDDITSELLEDIWYIVSIYRGVPNFQIYSQVLDENNYDYTGKGFISPEERENLADQKYDEHYYTDDETEYDPEIYGCSVKVRFPNGKTYKYNCKFDDVNVDDIVIVTGKMKNIKGKVIERLEMWDTAEYMEEVLTIVEED